MRHFRLTLIPRHLGTTRTEFFTSAEVAWVEVEAWRAVQAKVTVVARVSLVSEMSVSAPIMRSVACRM